MSVGSDSLLVNDSSVTYLSRGLVRWFINCLSLVIICIQNKCKHVFTPEDIFAVSVRLYRICELCLQSYGKIQCTPDLVIRPTCVAE